MAKVEKDVEKIVGVDMDIFKKEWKKKIRPGLQFKDDDFLSIPTSSVKLDWALRRPFLEGSIVEISAPNGTGKTTLALEVCSNAMRMGKLAWFVDLEYKLREAQLNMIKGFNKDKFTIIHPDTGEEAMNIMHEIIVNYPGSLIVLDSVGALLPEVENAEDYGKQSRALVARLCHQMIRKITGIANRNKCVLIFLNHPTSTMAMFGKAETTHGGRAIRNRAAQRIELFAPAAGKIKKDDEVIGQMVRATILKNNVNRPYIKVEFPIMFGYGIDSALDMVQFTKDLGIIQKGGGWYTVPMPDGESKKMREYELLEMLNTDEAFFKFFRSRVDALFV